MTFGSALKLFLFGFIPAVLAAAIVLEMPLGVEVMLAVLCWAGAIYADLTRRHATQLWFDRPRLATAQMVLCLAAAAALTADIVLRFSGVALVPFVFGR